MSEIKPLVIVGGGGFAREVIWLASECRDQWQPHAILDDNPTTHGNSICEVPVKGPIDSWDKYPDAWFIIAVGSPRTKKVIVQRMEAKGKPRFATLTHPSVLQSSYVSVGEGSIIAAGSILTTQVNLGKHTIINLASTIGHDVVMGDYCTIAPQAAISGNVTIGDGVEFGTGSIIIQGVSIETGAFIGAGALVSKNIPSNVLVVGSPARQIKSIEDF
jgi:sugar O-acyltransferase (sialic acid O-acetyltransferase NeuD family)